MIKQNESSVNTMENHDCYEIHTEATRTLQNFDYFSKEKERNITNTGNSNYTSMT